MHVYSAVLTANASLRNIVLAVLKEKGNVLIAKTYLQNAALIISLLHTDLLRPFINNQLACCARRLLATQSDFQAQRCEIEENIQDCTSSGAHHLVMYYPKYHCELNHIEHFWCSAKQHARENCEYTLEHLQRRVPLALASVKNDTILAYYHCCQRKMSLYREGIGYGSETWKACTAHHKVTIKREDQ